MVGIFIRVQILVDFLNHKSNTKILYATKLSWLERKTVIDKKLL